MRLYFYVSPENEDPSAVARAAAHFCSLGHECLADAATEDRFNESYTLRFLDEESCKKDCDVIVAVGGDGTILRASQTAIQLDKPILGINSGRLGYLSAFDIHELDCITAASLASLQVSRRLLLKASLDGGEPFFAVNDVVVRGCSSKSVELDWSYDDHLLTSFRADGLIFASPTGSTAYSLSAGGPIVDPTISAVVATPICAHSMVLRSVLFACEGRAITVTPAKRTENTAAVSADGEHLGMLRAGQILTVNKSERYLKLLTVKNKRFYEVLRKDISERG